MRQLRQGMWLILLAYWVTPALAADEQAVAASAVQSAAQVSKKVSANPEQDYQDGLKLMAVGDSRGDLDAYMDGTMHLKLAAEAGHAAAQARYALSLERGQLLDEAIKYYHLSAVQGHMDGQAGIGMIHFNGEGVPRDFTEARKWFALAGEQGHKVAIFTMASVYLWRVRPQAELERFSPLVFKTYTYQQSLMDDAERNSPEALLWIQRAADADMPLALEKLAEAYRSGQLGLAVDTKKADEYLAKSNKANGVAPVVVRKRSGLYKFLRGDDSGK